MDPNTRITKRFRELRQEGRAGFIPFLTAGDPDFATALKLLRALRGAGADLIEIGMPFSDPMADGPSIQLSSQRALRAGQTLEKTLQLVEMFREDDMQTPLVLMGYYNPIYRFGPHVFVERAARAGVDGLLIVDLPPEADAELCLPARKAGIDFIRLITPTTDEKRLNRLLENSSGFLYYVSMTGITGASMKDEQGVLDALRRLRGLLKLPLAVGFGIRTPEQAARMADVADAVVVGSALVERIASLCDPRHQDRLVAQTVDDARNLARAIHAHRR